MFSIKINDFHKIETIVAILRDTRGHDAPQQDISWLNSLQGLGGTPNPHSGSLSNRLRCSDAFLSLAISSKGESMPRQTNAKRNFKK